MDTLQVVAVIQQELQSLEKMLEDKVRSMERLEREIVDLRKLVEAYRAVLEHRMRRKPMPSGPARRGVREPASGGPVVESVVAGMEADQQAGKPPSAGLGGAMPPRLPEYAGLSVGAAVEAIAAQRDGTLHADDFARAIWQVRGEDDLRAAKRTLNTELLRRVRRGSLERAGRNVYRRAG